MLVTSQSPDVRDWSMSVLVLGWEKITQGDRSTFCTKPPRTYIKKDDFTIIVTIEVDIEMWKNFPLPPWGIALVKKNLCPSWEKSGASFCRKERKTSGCDTSLQGFNISFFFFLTYSYMKLCFLHLPVCATSSHSHPHVSVNNKRISQIWIC